MPRAHAHKRFDILPTRPELTGECASLLFGQPAERRSAANLPVVAFGFFTAKRGDRVCQRLSRRPPLDANDFGIREQAVQERFDVLQRFRATEVEKENSDFHCWCR